MNKHENEIELRDIDYLSDRDCRLLSRWTNDPNIRHLFCRFPDQGSSEKTTTPESFKALGTRSPETHPCRMFMVLLNENPIGFASFEIDPEHLLSKTRHTAWLTVVIGEEKARGRGFGKTIMKKLEQAARREKAHFLEIGVFEFNEKALSFYKFLGYHIIERVENVTYWNGKMWAEIRMIKNVFPQR